MTTHETTAGGAGAGADKKMVIAMWVAQIVPAAIFLFAGVMKFLDPSTLADGLGVAAVIVYLIGALELGTAILLIAPKTAVYGALVGVVIMIGALGSHATKLGWTGDLGGMWWMALIVLAGCIATLALRKRDLQAAIAKAKRK